MQKSLKKMILTDDDNDILSIAQFSLENMPDVAIRYCSSGQETIQEALKSPPDLIILDVMMPKMDGIATFNAFKLLPAIMEIPVIFLTARIQREEVESYLKLGAIAVITKPFDPLKLGSIIQNHWETYVLRQDQLGMTLR